MSSSIDRIEVEDMDSTRVNQIFQEAYNGGFKVYFEAYDSQGKPYTQQNAQVYLCDNIIYIGNHQFDTTLRYVKIQLQDANDNFREYVTPGASASSGGYSYSSLEINQKLDSLYKNSVSSLNYDNSIMIKIDEAIMGQKSFASRFSSLNSGLDDIKSTANDQYQNLWAVMNGAISLDNVQKIREEFASNKSRVELLHTRVSKIDDSMGDVQRSLGTLCSRPDVNLSIRDVSSSLSRLESTALNQQNLLGAVRQEVSALQSSFISQGNNNRSQSPSPVPHELQTILLKVNDVSGQLSQLRSSPTQGQLSYAQANELSSILSGVRELNQRFESSKQLHNNSRPQTESILTELRAHKDSLSIMSTVLNEVRSLNNSRPQSEGVLAELRAHKDSLTIITSLLNELRSRPTQSSQPLDLPNYSEVLRQLSQEFNNQKELLRGVSMTVSNLPNLVQNGERSNAMYESIRNLIAASYERLDVRFEAIESELRSQKEELRKTSLREASVAVNSLNNTNASTVTSPLLFSNVDNGLQSRMQMYGLTEGARLGKAHTASADPVGVSGEDLKLHPRETQSPNSLNAYGAFPGLTQLPNYGWPRTNASQLYFESLFRKILLEFNSRAANTQIWYTDVMNQKIDGRQASVAPYLAGLFEFAALAPQSKEQLAWILELALVIKGQINVDDWNLLILARCAPSSNNRTHLDQYFKSGTPVGTWSFAGVRPSALKNLN